MLVKNDMGRSIISLNNVIDIVKDVCKSIIESKFFKDWYAY